jgi:uncharacterized membrane protein YbhN (UPF0104 family)
MPNELEPRRLARRTAQIVAVLAVVGLILVLAPGLGSVRELLTEARPEWVALAVAFEALSCVSYVLMFRPVFCQSMPWRTSWEIGLLGPDLSPWLTVVPAAGALLVIGAVLLIPRFGLGAPLPADAGRTGRAIREVRKALVGGTREAVQIVRSRNLLVIAGSLGYWAWDNAVLWAAFHAFGQSPPVTVILMGYLIGQLGGLLPLPGGLGGIDGGLIGTLIVYGAPAAATAAAVVVYRVILFWLPLLAGAVAFISLRRGLNRPDRPELCVVPAAT